jgi:hypothetical protein
VDRGGGGAAGHAAEQAELAEKCTEVRTLSLRIRDSAGTYRAIAAAGLTRARRVCV